MKYLEKIRVVQFFLFEQQEVPLAEITGIFGPNGSGKSSLLDAVQIAMLGANSRLFALNAQADEQATTRSPRDYCLGQYGESPDHRARDNATTYITLIWRDTENGAPLSMGVCLYASADRDGHEVLGRYIVPDIELSMGDHLEIIDGEERPRAWTTFRHQLIERSKVSGQDPLYTDSDRYIRAALLALRGASSAPVPEAFTRAFRFALRMRFDKSVDQIVRNDVLEARPTNIKKFKEVTESFRRLAEMVAEVETKIADGERVSVEYEKAADESRRVATWYTLSKKASAQVAGDTLEQAKDATAKAEDNLLAFDRKKIDLGREAEVARQSAQHAREKREGHFAHKDYGALQIAIQTASGRVQQKRTDIANSILLVRNTLTQAASSDFLTMQRSGLQVAVAALDQLKVQVVAGTMSHADAVNALQPALKTASSAFTELFEQGSELKHKVAEAKKNEGQAKDNLARVRAGRAPLSSDVQRLLSELGDHGVHATPVCDLVRIVDPEWQPVMESYLGRNMEALLVSANQEKDAFRIYRGLRGAQTVYGAKIAMESRQALGRQPEHGAVSALIDGDYPAAVAYLQRQFGDLRCASSDNEALTGQRTLTKDGMLVSGGDIERLRLVPPSQFRIGAGTTDHRKAVQEELDHWQGEVRRLEALDQKLSTLVNALRQVAHEDTMLKFVGEAWGTLDEAQREIATKTDLLKGAADAEYVRLGEEENQWSEQASLLDKELQEVSESIGRAKSTRDECNRREEAANITLQAALEAVSTARNNPEVDRDYESRHWDVLLEKFDEAFALMVQYADEQQRSCRRRMEVAIANGNRELGVFLQKYREHAPQEIAGSWVKSREWLQSLLKKLNETELAPYKDEMDKAYRTSQETFRNDVAIALSNNLDWLEETMTRLNTVLRECPAFSNGERYRFRRVARPQLEQLLKFVKNVAAYGPNDDMFGGPGELPEEFRALLEDKVAPGATGMRSPLDDYREFFEFDIEILREDPLTKTPKVVGHLSKRLGPGSGGEHRAPLYVIAGAALASAYHLDRGNKDGLRLMLLDEAFNKMDPTNIIATMRYLEELGLQVFMASPGENLGILTAFLHRYYDILRDIDNNAVMIEGHDVSEKTRALFREDLPEFNPGLVDQEVAAMRQTKSPVENSAVA